MAFFEQIGKKLADAGQGVAQQTKNLAEVTKLSASIMDKERKVNQLYAAIGQAYYEKCKDDPARLEIPQVGELDALLAEIAQAKQEIEQIKNVRKCPSCGAEVTEDAAFCTACGTKLSQTTEG